MDIGIRRVFVNRKNLEKPGNRMEKVGNVMEMAGNEQKKAGIARKHIGFRIFWRQLQNQLNFNISECKQMIVYILENKSNQRLQNRQIMILYLKIIL